MNDSNYSNSCGFNFERINRASDRFPRLTEAEGLDLRRKCQLRYNFFNERGELDREDRIVLCRDVPAFPGEKGDLFEVYDLHAVPPKGTLCKPCSKQMQRPIRHGAQACPFEANVSDIAALKQSTISCGGPDPNRIVGLQNDKMQRQNLMKPTGAFPCRFKFGDQACNSHFYKRAVDANKHMTQYHHLSADDPRQYPAVKTYLFPCKYSESEGSRCKSGYCTAKAANAHMQQQHGLQVTHPLLYQLPSVCAQR